MTIQEALQNIDIVVSNAKMKRDEHVALQDSIDLLAQRCRVADMLKEQNQGDKELKKETEVEKCPNQPAD